MDGNSVITDKSVLHTFTSLVNFFCLTIKVSIYMYIYSRAHFLFRTDMVIIRCIIQQPLPFNLRDVLYVGLFASLQDFIEDDPVGLPILGPEVSKVVAAIK